MRRRLAPRSVRPLPIPMLAKSEWPPIACLRASVCQLEVDHEMGLRSGSRPLDREKRTHGRRRASPGPREKRTQPGDRSRVRRTRPDRSRKKEPNNFADRTPRKNEPNTGRCRPMPGRTHRGPRQRWRKTNPTAPETGRRSGPKTKGTHSYSDLPGAGSSGCQGSSGPNPSVRYSPRTAVRESPFFASMRGLVGETRPHPTTPTKTENSASTLASLETRADAEFCAIPMSSREWRVACSRGDTRREHDGRASAGSCSRRARACQPAEGSQVADSIN